MTIDKIVFFDGTCGLCNGWVRFCLARDRRHTLRFSPLQGEVARLRLPAELISEEKDLSSIVFLEGGRVYTKSTAVLRILQSLGGVWGFSGVFWVIPACVRDFVYGGVAKYRYRIFGKLESCRLPSADEREWFL